VLHAERSYGAWRTDTAQMLWSQQPRYTVFNPVIAVSHSGSLLALSYENPEYAPDDEVPNDEEPEVVAIHSSIVFIDAATGSEVSKLENVFDGQVTRLAFSADDSTLVVAMGEDQTVSDRPRH